MENRKKEIENGLQNLGGLAAEFRDKKSPEACQHLFDALDNLHDSLREEMQAETSSRIEDLMSRLDSDNKLSPDDMALVRLWVIGDAEAYLKVAPDIEQYQTKLDGLLQKVSSLDTTNPADILHIQGIFKEAQETLLDIQKLMEQKNRLERFEKTMANYKPSDASFLKAILDHKLQSPRD